MSWKLARSDNHKWEPEEAFASLTTVRLNFNAEASRMLDVGGKYDLYTDKERLMFKVVPNKAGRKLSDGSNNKTRSSMTYAHLGTELPPGRYYYLKGTKYEFRLRADDAVNDLVKNYPEYDGAVVKSAQLTEATQERKDILND